MMNAIDMPAARAPRAPHSSSSDAATGAADGSDPAADAQAQAERALAVRKQVFDEETEQRSEFEREREVLEQLMLAQLKDEDAIVKKWIEMI
jgi:hypothetical protein